MESSKKNNNVIITLTNEESLVLFNWLSVFNDAKHQIFEDESEQKILWDLESALEEQISETFSDNYLEIVSKARQKIKET